MVPSSTKWSISVRSQQVPSVQANSRSPCLSLKDSTRHSDSCAPHLVFCREGCVSAQLCLTLCDPMNCSLPGSLLRGISQSSILGWVAIPFSKGSSQPRGRTQVSCTAGGLPAELPVKPIHICISTLFKILILSKVDAGKD